MKEINRSAPPGEASIKRFGKHARDVHFAERIGARQ
jgi:hypothetical protein